MGPPRSKHTAPRPPSRSRFQEGSMNDRTSAVPPMQFLVPSPSEDSLDGTSTGDWAAATVAALARPASVAADGAVQFDEGVGEKGQEGGSGGEGSGNAMGKHASWSGGSHGGAGGKKSSGIFGQVWGGVFGRFRSRRDAAENEDDASASASSSHDKMSTEFTKPAKPTSDNTIKDTTARPSRDEVMANYQHLVETGFFTNHAIPSTRQPPPSPSRPQTSSGPRSSKAPSRVPPPPPPKATATIPSAPQWPLNPQPLSTVPKTCVPSAVSQSPGPRGKKRGASNDQDTDESLTQDGTEKEKSEKRALLPSPRKLRKSASRDVSGPKLRNVPSRRALFASRSFSTSNTTSVETSQQSCTPRISTEDSSATAAAPSREPNRLTKRSSRRNLIASLSHSGTSTGRRNVSESTSHLSVTRILRPRRSAESRLAMAQASGNGNAGTSQTQGVSIVPSANKGIPNVPDIPLKYTYGEDRENDGPWRGLRR